MEIMQPAATWKSHAILCPPPSAQQDISAQSELDVGLLFQELEDSLLRQTLELFFRQKGQVCFLPLCLMSSAPADYLKNFLMRLGKKFLEQTYYKTFSPLSQKDRPTSRPVFANHALEFIDLKKLTDPLETLRDLQTSLLTKSAEEVRVIFLNGVDSLSLNAKDALLKFLEEPPVGIQLILVTHHFNHLPFTFLSRCLKAHIVLERTAWREWSTRLLPDEKKRHYFNACLRVAQNDPIFLLTQLRPELSSKYEEFAAATAKAYSHKNLFSLMKFLLNGQKISLQYLNWYEMILSHCAALRCEERLPDRARQNGSTFFSLIEESFEIMETCLKELQKARQYLLQIPHINPELVMSSMFNRQQQCLVQASHRKHLESN